MRRKPLRFWAGKWYDQMCSFTRIALSSDLLSWDGTLGGLGWRQGDQLESYCHNPAQRQWTGPVGSGEVGRSHWILNNFERRINRSQWQNEKDKRRKSQDDFKFCDLSLWRVTIIRWGGPGGSELGREDRPVRHTSEMLSRQLGIWVWRWKERTGLEVWLTVAI